MDRHREAERKVLAQISRDLSITSMDTWTWWNWVHGTRLAEGGFKTWEIAAIQCIVRHSRSDGYAHGTIPRDWLFEGGPDGKDSRLVRANCRGESRDREIRRLREKIELAGLKLKFDFRVESDKGPDGERVVYTALWGKNSIDIPPPGR